MCLYFLLPWKWSVHCLPKSPNWGRCWLLHSQHHCRSQINLVRTPWSLDSCNDSRFRQLSAVLTPTLWGLWLCHKNSQAVLSPDLRAPACSALSAGLRSWKEVSKAFLTWWVWDKEIISVESLLLTLPELFPKRVFDKVKHHLDCCLFSAALCYLHNEALMVLASHTISKEMVK